MFHSWRFVWFVCMDFLAQKFYHVTNGKAQNPNYIECRGTHHARGSFIYSNCWLYKFIIIQHTLQVWMKSSSYQIDGRDNHILLTRDAEWQSKCFKVQTDVSNVQGVPKKRTFRMLWEPQCQCTGSITSNRHPLCLEINFLVVSY